MYLSKSKIIFLLLFSLLFSTLLFATSSDTQSQEIIPILLGAFLSGVLLTFTPCVLPMIPIISSIIAGQGADITKSKALALSLAYVMGTAVTYAVMGALAGATGEHLQSYFQNIWVISTMSLVFVLMALSMFGLFTIQLPSFVQSRLNAHSQGIKGGNILMVFLLGLISALILGACVSPVLISFLSVSISTGDAVLGALTMFFLALGMGVPLVLVGLGAGHWLPRAGGWMDKVKYLFGVMLLGVAIVLFSSLNLLPTLLLWGILFVIVAVYLGATNTLSTEAKAGEIFAKGVGTVLLIWGTFLLIGASYGEENLLKPLPKRSVISPDSEKIVSKEIPFETITTMNVLKRKQKEAQSQNKTLIIYFYTDWCPVCKHLKETTLIDNKIRDILKKSFIAVKVNMTDTEDKGSQTIKKTFKILGPPSFVFFDKEGETTESYNLYGYQEVDDFADTLELISE